LDCFGDISVCNFWEVHFTAVIMPKILGTNQISLELFFFWKYF